MYRKNKSAVNILSKEPAVIWRKGRIFQAKGKGTGTAGRAPSCIFQSG